MRTDQRIAADVAVIGAGAAGLFTALTAQTLGARVALVSATELAQTASYWAQGGLAAALAEGDSPAQHQADTERAGRGLVRTSAAAVLCAEAPARVAELEALGVSFDADRYGRLSLGLEGGHSLRRVVHAGGSATGRRVVRQLSAIAVERDGIEVLEGARAGALLVHDGRCVGTRLGDGRTLEARAVVMCSGGAAALWSRTTNPPGSVGTGLMLAHEAGAELADLELVQFHPTAVTGVAGREGFLVTEAIRGEGARLLDAGGERFVDELAPRDEVAAAIAAKLAEQGTTAVMLDMRAIDPASFPNVVSSLAEAGLDATRELIPVAPAAHYGMGGIVTDLNGATSLAGLYAVGEAACTGLHGANRLASNSLTECFVFGGRAARAALDEPHVPAAAHGPGADDDVDPGAAGRLQPSRDLRALMWRCAGLERSAAGLTELAECEHPLARLVATCALARTETRGAHRRTDFPATDARLDMHHTVVSQAVGPPVASLRRWD